jgi:hypothetical protein
MSDQSEDLLAALLVQAEKDAAEERAERKAIGEKIDALHAKIDAMPKTGTSVAVPTDVIDLIAEVRALKEATQQRLKATASGKGAKRKISFTVTERDGQQQISGADITIS